TVASFELSGTLGDDPGFFSFGQDAICFGRASRGSLSARSDDPLHDALDDVTIGCGRVSLPFDPSEIVENLRYEGYRVNGNGHLDGLPCGSAARSLYYGLRPFLP